MRVLITGYCGFVGPYLAQLLEGAGAELYGSTFLPLEHRRYRWGALDSRVAQRPCDFTRPDQVLELIRWARPDRIFHLAAQSHVPTSYDNPALTRAVNVDGARALLNAVKTECPDAPPRILIVGSGTQYGKVDEADMPIAETHPANPPNPYAETKVEQERLALAAGLPLHCVRAFNHIGPGQSTDFVVSAFARQVARIQLGLQPPVLRVGNLEVWRDFTDVRDVVRAYVQIIELDPPGEIYNVASGREFRIGEILDRLIALAGVAVSVERDPDLYRPSDQVHYRGDAAKLRARTNWRPEIPLDHSLKEIYGDWHTQETQK